MFITKKKHESIIAKIRKDYEEHLVCVRDQRDRAQALFSILDKLADKITFISNNFSGTTLTVGGSYVITEETIKEHLPENVAQYVDDFFGGRCIRQEAAKVIAISAGGDVTTGWITKRQPGAGRGYVLVEKE